MELVIKGAYYYDEPSDKIVVPHYTGEWNMVDVDEFIRYDDLVAEYDEEFISEYQDLAIEYNGESYYYAESNACTVDNWVLLSDLSDLAHSEEDYDF